MDDADLTQERQEREHDALMRASRKPAGPQPTGRCLWCDEPVGPGVRWCCVDCRDEWEGSRK